MQSIWPQGFTSHCFFTDEYCACPYARQSKCLRLDFMQFCVFAVSISRHHVLCCFRSFLLLAFSERPIFPDFSNSCPIFSVFSEFHDSSRSFVLLIVCTLRMQRVRNYVHAVCTAGTLPSRHSVSTFNKASHFRGMDFRSPFSAAMRTPTKACIPFAPVPCVHICCRRSTIVLIRELTQQS